MRHGFKVNLTQRTCARYTDGIVVFNHGRSGFFQFLRDSLQMFGDHIAHQNIAAGRSGRNHIGARLDLVGNDGIRCSM